MIIVNGWKPLTIITKRSTLDVAAVLDPPLETSTFDDRDPSWINKKAKRLILEKNEMYKRYVKENKDPKIFGKVKYLQNKLNSIIESNKQKYYSRLSNKVIDPMTS